jgi:hypothetical protein
VTSSPSALDLRAGVLETREPVFVQGLVPQPSIERFDVCVLVRLARLMGRSVMPLRCAQLNITVPLNSGPLSDRITAGRPRREQI